MNFIKKMLMRLARKVLDNVLQQLMQQFNTVQELALAPMRMMIQQVTGGIWRGRGADAFVEEVSSLMIPGVGRVAEQIQTYSGNLQFARDVMDRADESVDRLIKSRVFDAFKFY
jgi:uncharacterized protein YukE